MFLLTILFVLIVPLVIWCIYFRIKLLYYHSKLPGPPAKSKFFGNAIDFALAPEETFKLSVDLIKKYSIFNVRILFVSGSFIGNAEDAEVILSNPIHHKKSFFYNLLRDWLKKGLLTSEGALWQQRRKILTTAFHFGILQQYVKTFNEHTELLVEALKMECDNPYIAINKHIVQFTLKSIVQSAMGTNLTFTTQREKNYKQGIIEIGKIFFYRLTNPIFLPKIVFFFHPLFYKERSLIKDLQKFTANVIAERKKNFEQIDLPMEEDADYVGKKGLAMLDLLLMAQVKDKAVDDKGIQEEIDTFIFEGHDTTSVSLQFTLMLLACHKKVQENVYKEICDVLENVSKKPTYADLQKMKYLERVIKESLRLYPSVPLISRILGSNVTTPSGYFLPKGTPIGLHLFAIHHDPKIFPDPEKFDPDRFLLQNSVNRNPFSFLPFSAGSRNCIGQKFAMLEMKAAVCGILANFVLEPVDTPETIVLIFDMLLRTKDDIRIQFVLREK